LSEYYNLKENEELKMKNIWAVSMVKNEEDIIESFCRYTMQFCDGLLIRDDNSQDHTSGIIKQLINEGLRIILFETTLSGTSDFGGYKFHVFNDLARQAFEERGADWVIPLDADEFLFCPDYSDPRAEIEKMDESFEYRLYSRTYIFEGPLPDHSVFLPYQFRSFLCDPKQGRMVKTILSKKLYFDHRAKISIGHHHLEFDAKPFPQIEFTDRLLSAHYPFRSVEQMLAKVIIGELNYKASLDRNNCGLHWSIMYDAIKKLQLADSSLVKRFSLFYSGIFETEVDSQESVETEPFRTDFLPAPIFLKYTNPQPGQYAYLDKILAGMESIIANFKNTIADYEQTKDALAACRKQIAGIEKSRFPKITRFFRKLFVWFQGNKDTKIP
jgi:hypothetical protein